MPGKVRFSSDDRDSLLAVAGRDYSHLYAPYYRVT
jgi:hypothetical protein